MVVAPAGLRLRFAAGTVRTGRFVVGGDPPVVVRLSPAAAGAVDGWRDGAPVGAEFDALAQLLIDLGIAEPRLASEPRLGDVAVVIPAHDAAGTLPALLASLPAGVAEVVVVDDGSTDATAEVARERGAKVVSHPRPLGPAAARNAGLAATSAPHVFFVDADARLDGDVLRPLAALLADPRCAAAAPRVVEHGPSALDMGPVGGRVAIGARVSFVPSAALVVRRDAMVAAGSFDESMHFGEDADLCWRLVDAGWRIRYEPPATVHHQHRTSATAAARRLFSYGTASGVLARRHPEAVAALTLGDGPVVALVRLLRAGLRPDIALGLVARDHVKQVRSSLWAVTRPWLPAFLLGAAVSRRVRWFLLVTLAVRHRGAWRAIGDDAAFAAGLWWGTLREGTLAPLAVRRREPADGEGNGWRVIARFG